MALKVVMCMNNRTSRIMEMQKGDVWIGQKNIVGDWFHYNTKL